MGRRWCEIDPWIRITRNGVGKDFCLIVGGKIDPDINEVDGAVAWKIHVHANDTYEVLGTYDGFGHGETVQWIGDVATVNHPFRFELTVPVLNSIAGEHLFSAWVYDDKKLDYMVGDHNYGGNALSFLWSEGTNPPEFEPAGTRWGGPYSPPNQ